MNGSRGIWPRCADLPAAPFDACDQASGRVSSQSLVRYKTNDYSVPVAYGHRDVWIRGYVDEVVIGCGGEIIARHPRCYEREDMVFDPVHYLPLIEQKINALGSGGAAARAGTCRAEFATLRRLMEARMSRHGRREYVQVLRLLESFDLDDLHAAVKKALQLGAIGFDAVKHLILCQVEKRPPRLDLDPSTPTCRGRPSRPPRRQPTCACCRRMRRSRMTAKPRRSCSPITSRR